MKSKNQRQELIQRIQSGDLADFLEFFNPIKTTLNANDAEVLTEAVKSGNVEILEQLAALTGVNFNQCGTLVVAATEANEKMLRFILNWPDIDVNCMVNGEAALHAAVRHDWPKGVLMLLRAGADVMLRNHAGKTPFFIAIESKCGGPIVLLLKGHIPGLMTDHLELKTDVNLPDKHGVTPLMCALDSNDIFLVKLLLEHDADVNAIATINSRFTAIHYATNNANREILRLLLERGAWMSFEGLEGTTIISALNHVVALWNKARVTDDNKSLQRRQDLSKCAEILLFYGAGIAAELSRDLLKMNLNMQRCCLFRAATSGLLKTNLITAFPDAIHTPEQLQNDCAAEMAMGSRLPFKQLLACTERRINLLTPNKRGELEAFYRLLNHLYEHMQKVDEQLSNTLDITQDSPRRIQPISVLVEPLSVENDKEVESSDTCYFLSGCCLRFWRSKNSIASKPDSDSDSDSDVLLVRAMPDNDFARDIDVSTLSYKGYQQGASK